MQSNPVYYLCQAPSAKSQLKELLNEAGYPAKTFYIGQTGPCAHEFLLASNAGNAPVVLIDGQTGVSALNLNSADFARWLEKRNPGALAIVVQPDMTAQDIVARVKNHFEPAQAPQTVLFIHAHAA